MEPKFITTHEKIGPGEIRKIQPEHHGDSQTYVVLTKQSRSSSTVQTIGEKIEELSVPNEDLIQLTPIEDKILNEMYYTEIQEILDTIGQKTNFKKTGEFSPLDERIILFAYEKPLSDFTSDKIDVEPVILETLVSVHREVDSKHIDIESLPGGGVLSQARSIGEDHLSTLARLAGYNGLFQIEADDEDISLRVKGRRRLLDRISKSTKNIQYTIRVSGHAYRFNFEGDARNAKTIFQALEIQKYACYGIIYDPKTNSFKQYITRSKSEIDSKQMEELKETPLFFQAFYKKDNGQQRIKINKAISDLNSGKIGISDLDSIFDDSDRKETYIEATVDKSGVGQHFQIFSHPTISPGLMANDFVQYLSQKGYSVKYSLAKKKDRCSVGSILLSKGQKTHTFNVEVEENVSFGLIKHAGSFSFNLLRLEPEGKTASKLLQSYVQKFRK